VTRDDASCMSKDIRSCLDSIGLAEYVEVFVHNGLDLDVLPELTEAHLRDLGVSLGHRLKILKAITKKATARPYPRMLRLQPHCPLPLPAR